MPVDVSTETLIRRPPGTVAAYAANPAPACYENIKAVEWKTPPPLAGRLRCTLSGRRLAYTYEIVDFVPEERLVMRTAEGPFPMETSYAWERTPQGDTRMKLRNRGAPAGFSKWIAPFMARAIRRANQKDLARLKELLEHDAAV